MKKEEIIEKIKTISHLIHEPKYCQNRNGLYFCGTCEQAWEDCSCAARNTGARNMKEHILREIAGMNVANPTESEDDI